MRTRVLFSFDSLLKILVALTLILAAAPARSDIQDPLRDPSRLISPRSEAAIRVASARVILADYALLRRDFPSLSHKSDAEIDHWILDNAAYVSVPQVAQEGVNSPIAVAKDAAGKAVVREALRPDQYKRALVFNTGEGLIDMKGAGSLSPYQGSHGNGLATTGEAIREFVYEHKVQQILGHSGLPHRTVGCYAVIDWGFDVIHADGGRSPAGAVLRQAHERYANVNGRGNTFLDPEESAQIERVLRQYGLTSSGEKFMDGRIDVINIQGNAKGELVDFGSYLVKPDFDKPTYSYMDGVQIEMRRPHKPPLIAPGTPGFVHPDPEMRLPPEIWGFTHTGVADPKYDNLWAWSHELAENLKYGRAQRQDVTTHFDTFMNAGKLDPATAGRAYRHVLSIAPLAGPNACAGFFRTIH